MTRAIVASLLLTVALVSRTGAQEAPRQSAIIVAAEVATCMTPQGAEWIVVAGTTQAASLTDG